MGELLRALVEDPEAIMAAARAGGLAPRDCRAVAREAEKVLRTVTVKTRYEELREFLRVTAAVPAGPVIASRPDCGAEGDSDAP